MIFRARHLCISTATIFILIPFQFFIYSDDGGSTETRVSRNKIKVTQFKKKVSDNISSDHVLDEDQWGVRRDPKTNNILINCFVKPTAPTTMLEDVNGTMNYILLQNPKVSGKGNRKLITFFSYILDVNRTSLSVIKGERTPKKVLELSGTNFTVPSVVRWIAQHIPPEGLLYPVGSKRFPHLYRRSN